MAKAKAAKENSVFSPIIDGVKKHVLDLIGALVQEKIKQLEKLGMEIALLLLFLLAGILFLLIAVVFVIHDELGIAYSGSFVIVGAISILLSFLLYKMIQKK